MIDRVNQIEEGLKLWRCIILVLTILMLVISIIENNQMSIIVLIICFFALILFQLKTLPMTSYQVTSHSRSSSFSFNLLISSTCLENCWRIFIRTRAQPSQMPSRIYFIWQLWFFSWRSSGGTIKKINVGVFLFSTFSNEHRRYKRSWIKRLKLQLLMIIIVLHSSFVSYSWDLLGSKEDMTLLAEEPLYLSSSIFLAYLFVFTSCFAPLYFERDSSLLREWTLFDDWGWYDDRAVLIVFDAIVSISLRFG